MAMNDDEISDATSICNPVDSYSESFECFSKIGLTRVKEPAMEYNIVKSAFFTGIGKTSELAQKTKIVAIHKNNLTTNLSGCARASCFKVFAKAVADKCGGNANVKYGWYGASRNEICEIAMYGFSLCNNNAAGYRDCYRNSISLSAGNFPLDSLLASEVDENGLRHVFLCRVILGKQELVTASSNQFHPTSPELDTGVDDLSAPRKYIIWSVYMNTHILPCFIISVKAPFLSDGSKGIQPAHTIKPDSHWMSFPQLISMLSRFLNPYQLAAVNKIYSDYRERKILRNEFITRVKEVAGRQVFEEIRNLVAKKIHEGSGSGGQAGAAKGR